MFILLALGTLAPAPAFAQRYTEFELECPLPWEGIEVARHVDGFCGHEGTASSAGGKVQNRAKNNLCAKGPVVDLTLSDFRELQEAADDAGIYRNPRGIPSHRWRAKLQDIWETADGERIGEGRQVRFIGYIDRAFHGAARRGESVNCKLRGPDHADIHIELGETPHPRECDRLITEVIPHYRPDEWNVDRLRDVRREGRPIRITGHLFWDASHSPCGEGEPEQWRATTWEIHPVYRIEVCDGTDIGECGNSSSGWTDLHEWESPWLLDDAEAAPVQPD